MRISTVTTIMPFCAEIKRNKLGVPALHFDGIPVNALMHWNRFPKTEDADFFRRAGINCFSFIGYLSLRKNPQEAPDYTDGMGGAFHELTPENIDRIMEMLLDANPNVKVLPRLRITAPDWWKKDFPETMMKCYSIHAKEWHYGPHVAVACKDWQNYYGEKIEETVEYFEHKWGDAIFGYHVGQGECAEHAYRWGDYIGDMSLPALTSFRQWLETRYITDEALQEAWNKKDITLKTVVFPSPERFLPEWRTDFRSVFLPASERDIIDFLRFSSDSMADATLFEAQTVKQTLKRMGRKKVVGTFYGYQNLFANILNDYCLGHYAQGKILSSPDIDFIAAPISYGSRQPGAACTAQVLPDSITLHGKLYYAEEDTRLHNALEYNDCVSDSPETSTHILRRNYLSTIRSGGGNWWMDLPGNGWFRDEALMPFFKEAVAIADTYRGMRDRHAQIAVYVSDESAYYRRCAPVGIHGSLVQQQLHELSAIGAPFDIFRLEDLPELKKQNRLNNYLFHIVLDAVAISSDLREIINSDLKGGNRTILWFYLPGIICNDKMDASLTAELTGFDLRLLPNEMPNSMLTETWFNGTRITYGHPLAILPRLISIDKEAEELGFYVEGTWAAHPDYGRGAALLEKNFSTWRSIWCSSPLLPGILLREFAKKAGVFIYSESGDPVSRIENLLCITARHDGITTLSLPQCTTVRNFLNNEIISSKCTSFSVQMKRGETKIFILNQ